MSAFPVNQSQDSMRVRSDPATVTSPIWIGTVAAEVCAAAGTISSEEKIIAAVDTGRPMARIGAVAIGTTGAGHTSDGWWWVPGLLLSYGGKASLLPCLGRNRLYDREILNQVLRHTVPFLQVLRTVVRNPDSPLIVFPHQNL